MPHPGRRWCHIILNTRCSWLHGSELGFRNRDHRIHSSGDYKRPPPLGEHAGLRRYHRARSQRSLCLNATSIELVLKALISKAEEIGLDCLVAAVMPFHAHFLVQMPRDHKATDRLIARIKQRTSHAVRLRHPGQVWAQGASVIDVRDQKHHREVFSYIRDRQGPEARVWTFREGFL